jgi:hypothetical protein
VEFKWSKKFSTFQNAMLYAVGIEISQVYSSSKFLGQKAAGFEGGSGASDWSFWATDEPRHVLLALTYG